MLLSVTRASSSRSSGAISACTSSPATLSLSAASVSAVLRAPRNDAFNASISFTSLMATQSTPITGLSDTVTFSSVGEGQTGGAERNCAVLAGIRTRGRAPGWCAGCKVVLASAMSAPPPYLPATLSTSGYSDGLGRRTLGFDRESGSVLERLVVRPELVAFERALRQRAERLGTFDDERVARLRDIEHDRQACTLTIVSEFVAGRRLSDLLDEAPARASDERAAPTVDVALGFLLQILPALNALHTVAGITHGAVGDGRIVISPNGEVVLLDAIYGPALERLQLSRRRLWTEFRIAAPPSAGPARFDVAGDLSQAALAAVAMTIGRPLGGSDYPDGLRTLIDETVEIAQLRGSARFASALQRFFERALPLPSRRIYATADEAAAAVQDLVAAEMGVERCRTALMTVVRDSEAAVPTPAATVETSIAASDEPFPIVTEPAPPVVAIRLDVAPEVVLPVAAPEVEPPVVAPAPQPAMDAPLAAAPEPAPVIDDTVYEPVEATTEIDAPLVSAEEPEPVIDEPVYEPAEATAEIDAPLVAAQEPEPVIDEPVYEPAEATTEIDAPLVAAEEPEPVIDEPVYEPAEAAAEIDAPLAAAAKPEPQPVIEEPAYRTGGSNSSDRCPLCGRTSAGTGSGLRRTGGRTSAGGGACCPGSSQAPARRTPVSRPASFDRRRRAAATRRCTTPSADQDAGHGGPFTAASAIDPPSATAVDST